MMFDTIIPSIKTTYNWRFEFLSKKEESPQSPLLFFTNKNRTIKSCSFFVLSRFFFLLSGSPPAADKSNWIDLPAVCREAFMYARYSPDNKYSE